MSVRNEKNEFEVDVVKMIRNNNMADERVKSTKEKDAYFMLDYFDLLFHKGLSEDEKVYRKFWHIESDDSKEALAYKASYKTLSLYAEKEEGSRSIWRRSSMRMSDTPFLGVIQINMVHHIYKEELEVENTFLNLEQKIIEQISKNIKEENQLYYRMYRSSTSSDFCLIVKSNKIESIFGISVMINNLVVDYCNYKFRFNTYTNIGIESGQNEQDDFYTFPQEIVDLNSECKFALRFTASSKFAQNKYIDLAKEKECYLTEHMDGLFGRYDFMVHLDMEEFAKVFPVLCKSKMVGINRADESRGSTTTLADVLCQGIEVGEIQIINERALVSLANIDFKSSDSQTEPSGQGILLKSEEATLKDVVKNKGEKIQERMNEFEKMKGEFIEERRAFIDICRELREVINTYVPQGMDHDSQVNWYILISDLGVVLDSIDDWEKFYKGLNNREEKKYEREHFLSDLRVATEAISQYYKFLQNVNAQTWQSPIYEIQTQLDAEKMMIAYREFLYEYFGMYKKIYDDRPKFYPIIYPDMSIDKVYVQAPFKHRGKKDKKLLICKVPSFEYYGRMYDMIPWILHEASHSFRTMDRGERNEYIARKVLYKVFEQAMYEVLNKYTNDFGYHKLGTLERDILQIVRNSAYNKFVEYCKDGIDNLEFIVLQTELYRYIETLFGNESILIEKKESKKNLEAIQKELLRHCKELGLFKKDCVERVQDSINSDDKMRENLLQIYYALFKKVWNNREPGDSYLQIVVTDTDMFEKKLYEQVNEEIRNEGETTPYQIMDYCFTMRQINRLYNTWNRNREIEKVEAVEKDEAVKIWEECIGNIRKKIEEGFRNNKGFTEIYRILNMVFGSGEEVSAEDAKRVGELFNIFSGEVEELVRREISIYSETCADIYMSATLGFNAFGYCRQSFQTASDISVEDSMGWEDGVNAHRFRMVTAVLLGSEDPQRELLDTGGINAEELFEQGREYCISTLECLKKRLLSMQNDKSPIVEEFIKLMKENVELLFEFFKYDVPVEKVLEGSALSIFAMKDVQKTFEDSKAESMRKKLEKKYQPIEDILDEYRHILYRIKYFIYALSTFGKKKIIYVDNGEYEHMKKLYQEYKSQIQNIEKSQYCSIVSEYYNDFQTAADMPIQSMLDHTIRFIEKYYYRNRFKVMSSRSTMKEVKENEGK